MFDVNKVILIGRLGKDPEGKFTPSGVSVHNFSIATSERWKDKESGEKKESTTWHNIVAWRMEWITKHVSKGDAVYIEGKLQTRSYEKDGHKVYVTEVVADTVNLLSASVKGKDGEGRTQTAEAPWD